MYDDNNRLIKEDDVVYRYDDNGNLIEKQSAEEQITYQYDYDNHLTRVETSRYGATIVVEYEYDANGNRVKKTIDGTITTSYLVDENRDYAQVLEERDGDGNLLVRYVYGHDLISQTRDGVTSYYHYDGLGSTRELTSSAGIVTDEYIYDAFGNLLDKRGVTVNTHLYTGEFFDSHLGFYYLRARYMNPQIGRFVTMDTFAGMNKDPYSLHKYLYAHANPVNMIDPSGYMSSYAEITVAGSIIGAMSGIYVYHVTHAPEERDALGYVTWGAGGGLIGGLLAHGAWYIWLANSAPVMATAFHDILLPGLNFDGKMGKLTQHAKEWMVSNKGGPKAVAARVANIAIDIYNNATHIRQGTWHQSVKDAIFYSDGTNIIVTKADGNFITILKNAHNTNKAFKAAKTIWEGFRS